MASLPNKGDGIAVNLSDETTPLLVNIEPAPISESSDTHGAGNATEHEEEEEDDDENTPLPKLQIFMLCYTSIVEPIAFFSIFPYISFMIEKIGGVKKEDVGFYSGLVESLFSATQMCVMIFWGRASDHWGRKPILIISLCGVAVATTLFGLSQNLWQMILARCFAGVFAGSVVTVRSMLSENSTKHTQAKAFSYFAFSRNMGLLLGPLLGGALETPANKYTSIFGESRFFRDFPYALPGMVTSVIALSAAFSTLLFVKETLHTNHGGKKTSDAAPMSTWQILKYPGVAQVLLVYNYVMLLAFTFTAVNPVFMYTPVKMGGFEFSPTLIAAFMALAGASQAVWLLLAFPILHKRVGTGRLLLACAWVWPFFFAMHPTFNVLLLYGKKTAFWVAAPPMMIVGSGVAMAFTAVQLALNDIAPSHETLGTLNAFALALTSGLRAVAPPISASIYALGVKYHILGGHLFWLTNVTLAFGLLGVLGFLPEKVKGKMKRQQNGRA